MVVWMTSLGPGSQNQEAIFCFFQKKTGNNSQLAAKLWPNMLVPVGAKMIAHVELKRLVLTRIYFADSRAWVPQPSLCFCI